MDIKTVPELVSALGGNKPVATLCGVSVQAVCNWKAEDRLPPVHHFRVYKECEARGLAVAPAIFGEVAA